MIENCKKEIIGIPYRSFKEKKNLVKHLKENGYKVEVLEGIVYAEK